MQPWYAKNALGLLEAREQGLKPEGWVIVAMVAGQFDSPTLYVRDDMPVARLDWRMVVALPVVVVAGPTVSLDRIVQVVHDIALAKPMELRLHFSIPRGEYHEIDVGSGIHIPSTAGLQAIHTFQWCPVTLHGTPVEYRLKAALRRHQPERWL